MSCGALGCVLRCAEAREEGGERPSLCPGGGYSNGWAGREGVPDAPTFSADTAAILPEGGRQIWGRVLLVRWYDCMSVGSCGLWIFGVVSKRYGS